MGLSAITFPKLTTHSDKSYRDYTMVAHLDINSKMHNKPISQDTFFSSGDLLHLVLKSSSYLSLPSSCIVGTVHCTWIPKTYLQKKAADYNISGRDIQSINIRKKYRKPGNIMPPKDHDFEGREHLVV